VARDGSASYSGWADYPAELNELLARADDMVATLQRLAELLEQTPALLLASQRSAGAGRSDRKQASGSDCLELGTFLAELLEQPGEVI